MHRLKSALLILALAVLGAPLLAQTVDTAITGSVTDVSGAVVPGATVTVASETTGIQKTAVSGSAGEYRVDYLIPGTYDVSVSATGFASYQQKAITIDLNQQARINITLQVGATTQVVTVQSAPPLLQTEASSLGALIGRENTESLPLNGRQYQDLAILTPGVTVTTPDFHFGLSGATVNSYGVQTTWGQFNIDGVTEVNNRSAYINILPSVDSIQEFKVLTGDADSEYGGGAGSVTNVQLKSGTNAFHGDVFEYVRNTAMDARNFFRPNPLPKQVLKQNQFGGTFGGPIIKDRSFFFLSYEGLYSIEDSPSLTNVLTAAERNGDFSALLPKKQLKNPLTGAIFANNRIPVDPVAQNIVNNYMPLPNANLNGDNYSAVQTGNLHQNQYLVHLDHKIKDSDQLTAHFIYEDRNVTDVAPDPHFKFAITYPMFNAAAQYVHTFSPSMVNEVRVGYDYEHYKSIPGNQNTGFTAASIGINGFVQSNGQPWPPSQEGFPNLSLSNYITLGDQTFGASNLDNSATYQIIDNFTWSRGKHTLIMGVDARFIEDNATTDNTPYGSITFNGAETGNGSSSAGDAGADFILGYPASLITPEGVPLTAARQKKTGTYFQDNWKESSKLTLNLGIRWDLWLPPHDNLDTSQTLNFSTPIPTLEPLPDPLWHISHKNFSPRVGFAYTLPHQLVVRSAYGLSFYGGKFDNINILQLNPPTDPSFAEANGTSSANPPTATLQNPISPSITPGTPNETSLPANDTRLNTYLQTWNLTVSKQFGPNVVEISYVGTKGTHQDTSEPYFNNGPPQAPGRSVNADRPYPTIGNIRILNFYGASAYDGLLGHYEHRISHGLEFTTAYAFAHLQDNQAGDPNGTNRNGTQIPTAKEWASGQTDVRHNLTVAWVYQLPKLSGGNALARGVLNGWQLSSIFQYISGSPLLVIQSADGENDGNLYQRPDRISGQPLHISNRSVSEWFNTAAFTQANGHYGSAPRNAVTGVAVEPLTAAIDRSFPMPIEGEHLEFRMEVFNTLNHPLFAAPGVSQGAGNFGEITSTTIDNREVQLVGKYFF